jgi:MarR family transcriptional regulator for hemolysin
MPSSDESAGTDKKISAAQLKRLRELSDLWRRYDQVYSDWAQMHGVSTNAMTLIEEMYVRPEGVEPAEIADYLGIPRQTMTTTLDGLERRGFLGRFPHSTDRRRKVVRFTEEGSKVAEALIGELHKWELEALTSISAREGEGAFVTVKKLCDGLVAGLGPRKNRRGAGQ